MTCLFRGHICRKINLDFEWDSLGQHLTNLSVVNPAGLFAGDECLTYIQQGLWLYHMFLCNVDLIYLITLPCPVMYNLRHNVCHVELGTVTVCYQFQSCYVCIALLFPQYPLWKVYALK